MRKGKTGGGPATKEGKKILSMNSFVHGSTSLVPVGPAKERGPSCRCRSSWGTTPESPLERLQIERIAVCKLKFDDLYELEELKLQLAAVDLARDSGQIT